MFPIIGSFVTKTLPEVAKSAGETISNSAISKGVNVFGETIGDAQLTKE